MLMRTEEPPCSVCVQMPGCEYSEDDLLAGLPLPRNLPFLADPANPTNDIATSLKNARDGRLSQQGQLCCQLASQTRQTSQ